ncbi:MAG: DUF1254 domain-containing protein [Pseudomonadales bacterium]
MMIKNKLLLALLAVVALIFSRVDTMAASPKENTSKSQTITVTAMNYVRAKTALQFDKYLARAGGVNQFSHTRSVVGIDNRSSRRLNRDTLYSVAIVDISEGATVQLPKVGNRYMSMQVVNEHGYTNAVFHGGGNYSLTQQQFDTPFVWLLIRTLVSSSDLTDLNIARGIQDKLRISSSSSRIYQHPNYDQKSFDATTHHLIELGRGLTDNAKAAGSKNEVDPIKQLLLSAYGFGTLPESESLLITVQPDLPSDSAYVLNVKDVPVDGFWSLAMYDKDGYFKRNDTGIYGYSNQSATKNKDGSISLHLGGDPSSINHIPLSEGWNYVVRLYRPREELLNGDWVFPEVREIKTKQ